MVVDTPAGAPAQTQHRDTILPGPCASLGVHIPLTAMQDTMGGEQNMSFVTSKGVSRKGFRGFQEQGTCYPTRTLYFKFWVAEL